MIGLWLTVHVICAVMLIGLCLGALFQTFLDRKEQSAAPAVLLSGLVLAGPCFAVLMLTGVHLAGIMRLPVSLHWIEAAIRDGAIAFVAFHLGLACVLWRLWRGVGRAGALVLFAAGAVGFSLAALQMLGQAD